MFLTIVFGIVFAYIILAVISSLIVNARLNYYNDDDDDEEDTGYDYYGDCEDYDEDYYE